MATTAAPAPSRGVHVAHVMSALRAPDDLYRFWRSFENLPRFMRYLDSVRTLDGNRSHWIARGPLDFRIEWDAEITADRPNQMIAWHSLPGSAVDTEGSVTFEPAPAGRGTQIKIVLRYDPPAGKLGDLVARLFGRSADQEIREDLRRFKRLMETGEVPTTRGQPSGRSLGRDPWEQTGAMVVQDRFAGSLGWFSLGLGLSQLLAPEAVARVCGVPDHHGLMRALGLREITTGLGILSRRPRPAGWLWGRVLGDAMDLALLAAALASPRAHKARTMVATAAVLGVTALDLAGSLARSQRPDSHAREISP